MEVQERPVFIPPRKRGSKSSPRSASSHQLNASPASGVNNPLSALSTPQHYPRLSPKESTSSPRLRSVSQEQVYNHQNTKNSSTPTYSGKGRKNCSFTPAKNVDIVIEEPHYERNRDSGENQDFDLGRGDSDQAIMERCALNKHRITDTNRFVTMTGTVKRGRKKGQTMNMQVHMSREELDELEQNLRAQKEKEEEDDCFFGISKGPHVLILSVLAFPVVLLLSGVHSFCTGTTTWYNVLVFCSERKSFLHKIFLSPILIIAYPFLIVLFTIGLGLYAAVIQISWQFEKWKMEVVDWEKGFYGWLCCSCHVEECSPYEVVILTEIQNQTNTQGHKQPTLDTAL